ncbi:Zinc finger CCCH domain-containing protein [Quillaja saponaria]|uniref:Zinc finger CCCH domain-containing protein n=1 Tax=Quillaja saponaria TaxID=32244 RepID=A0AAD7LKE3_QUISA|nr:Zinc finger CCCH domain-containing protein [Quillaja saponaria]
MNPLTLVKRIQKINSREAELGIGDEASWHAKYKDSAYVFVGGIPFDLTEGDLLAVFAQYGEVVDVNLVRDKGTGKSKGFAFIAYEDQRSTNLAVDNLNGAQILGRTIRVDHVSKYKKKEEEDEEAERQKREARGVCRAFQRGECTRGAGCKFSHDEQRAANTGWGHEDNSSKWGNDKFDGPRKGEKRADRNLSSHVTDSADKNPRPRAQGDDTGIERYPKQSDQREEKILRRSDAGDEFVQRENHDRRDVKRSRRDDDEYEHRSREDRRRRDARKSREDDDHDFEPKPREDHNVRGERSGMQDNVEFKLKSRDIERRDEKTSSMRDNDKFETQSGEGRDKGENISRRHSRDEFVSKSGEGHSWKEDNRSRDDFDRREDKRSRRY